MFDFLITGYKSKKKKCLSSQIFFMVSGRTLHDILQIRFRWSHVSFQRKTTFSHFISTNQWIVTIHSWWDHPRPKKCFEFVVGKFIRKGERISSPKNDFISSILLSVWVVMLNTKRQGTFIVSIENLLGNEFIMLAMTST